MLIHRSNHNKTSILLYCSRFCLLNYPARFYWELYKTIPLNTDTTSLCTTIMWWTGWYTLNPLAINTPESRLTIALSLHSQKDPINSFKARKFEVYESSTYENSFWQKQTHRKDRLIHFISSSSRPYTIQLKWLYYSPNSWWVHKRKFNTAKFSTARCWNGSTVNDTQILKKSSLCRGLSMHKTTGQCIQ